MSLLVNNAPLKNPSGQRWQRGSKCPQSDHFQGVEGFTPLASQTLTG